MSMHLWLSHCGRKRFVQWRLWKNLTCIEMHKLKKTGRISPHNTRHLPLCLLSCHSVTNSLEGHHSPTFRGCAGKCLQIGHSWGRRRNRCASCPWASRTPHPPKWFIPQISPRHVHTGQLCFATHTWIVKRQCQPFWKWSADHLLKPKVLTCVLIPSPLQSRCSMPH